MLVGDPRREQRPVVGGIWLVLAGSDACRKSEQIALASPFGRTPHSQVTSSRRPPASGLCFGWRKASRCAHV
jgi:hypothetical protein